MSARGEGVITLQDEDEVRILYTNRALAQAEEKLGRGIFAVLQEMYDGNVSINDVVSLLHVGMEAARRDAKDGSKPVSRPKAFAVLEEAGIANVLAPVAEAIATVLSYGTDSELDDDELLDDTDPN